METNLSKEIQQGLHGARLAGHGRSRRLRLEVDGVRHPVLRMWKTGFSIDAEQAPRLRGLVDLYDGNSHVFQCLIVAGDEDAGEMRYEFKRATLVAHAAALDFELPQEAASARIGDSYM